jgi:hypothetical protein
MLTQHIDAANDAEVSIADKDSAPLDFIGVYRAPGPGSFDAARYVEYDVTALVKNDVTAGRATFAWRVEPESVPAGWQTYRIFPTVDNQAAPLSNRSKLILKITGQYESSCTDGTDNDGDGVIDCGDADCYGTPECPAEVCGDGADNDGDQAIDCDDTDCVFNTCCETPLEICTNSVDDDGDELVDCDDSDCRCAANCGAPPAEVCDNGIDDDCDGDADCADGDCSTKLACRGCNDPFADQDDDSDVDQEDFGIWQACFTGTEGTLAAGCGCADWDGNGRVDMADFDKFQICASGPTVMAAGSCDD